MYCNNKCVIAALQYQPDKFIVVVDQEQWIYKIDRATKRCGNLVSNPSSNRRPEYCGLQPFPNYDFNNCPYFILRDKTSMSVINIKKEQIMCIIPTCPLSITTVERTSFFDMSIENGMVALYNLEVDQRNIGGRTQRDSTVKKYLINVSKLQSW